MDNELVNVLVVIITSLAMVVWWFTSKGASHRKYILLLSIFWFLTIVTYIIGTSFDLKPLGVITIITLVIAIYFLVRAVLLDNKAKKEISDK